MLDASDNEEKRPRTLFWGLLTLLAIGLATAYIIYRSRGGDRVDVRTQVYPLRCVSPSCGQVQNWTGQRIYEERGRLSAQEPGEPAMLPPQLKCPLCSSPLIPVASDAEKRGQ